MAQRKDKPINLDIQKSRDYAKKISLMGKTVIKERNKYTILVFISGRSFRNLNKKDKQLIKQKLKKEISKINPQVVSSNYTKKLVVRLKLFLTRPYYNRVDVDNVAKTVLDCLHGISYKNDKQVIHLESTKLKVSDEDKGAIGLQISEWLAITRV